MAVTNQQILGFLNANPGISDAEIVAAMEAYGVSPSQMAQAVGVTEGEVAARVAATIPEGQAKLLGDTWVQPQYQVTGSGEDRQVGGIENVQVYKNTGGGGINDEVAVGTQIQEYNPDGTFSRTTQTQKTDNSMLPFILGAAGLFGGIGGGFESLFGGGAAAGTAGTVGTTGLTMGELAQLDLALGGAGGTAGATALANSLMTGAGVGTLTNLTGGSGTGTLGAGSSLGTGLTTAGATGLGGLTGAAGLGGGLGTGLTTTGAGLGTGLITGAGTGVGTGLGTTLAGVGTGVGAGVGSTLTGVGTGVGTALGTGLTTGATGGLTAAQLGALLSGGLTTGAGLLQQQTSREAAQRAQAMIDAETAAAKAAAQFRPVGVTTRFGTSQFEVDPVTGQLKSAEYTLSPEAKYAQDKLVAQANLGLQQIEQAQGQFAPLQTGAQSLFALGNQYLAQTPEQVAQNYINQQMALLQPGRELELANLQNKLQQQGRAGLSVAQGGALGATTPELQALYNARAQQEAILAAQAQQAGQQQVAFGAGLLGQGAGAMGQYYAGQQAAYAPYTTALGQVQALEAAGQQPLTMGAALGQQAAQAGANVGRLGLTGAGQSVALATGPAATNNPYSSLMASLGSSPAFGQGVAGLLTGGLSGLQSAFSQTGLGSSGFGTGLAYGNQDLGLFL
jgi:hypothetical protein